MKVARMLRILRQSQIDAVPDSKELALSKGLTSADCQYAGRSSDDVVQRAMDRVDAFRVWFPHKIWTIIIDWIPC
jgi:hypothetical protein